MSTAPAHPELDVLIHLAKAAGDIILNVADRARKNPSEKDDDQGPVTEADLRANAFLEEALSKVTTAPLVTEESWDLEATLPQDPVVWFIDPLDGTKDFIRGGDDYAVMIGRAYEGEPDVGVVYQPASGLTWAGSTLTGEAFRENADGVRIDIASASANRANADGMRVAVSRNHPSELAATLAEKLGATAVRKGSVGLKIGMLVDDQAELYLSGSRHIKVWDTCGPGAILRAAGGTMTQLDGSPHVYRKSAPHPRGVRAVAPTVTHRSTDIDNVIAGLLARHQPFASRPA